MADDLFANLQAGSYEGVVFAVIDVSIETGSAAAFHKFPYRPGQNVELTGREPVSGTISAAMFNSLTQFRGGANNVMWPDGIQLLREKVQEQKTGKLVVPTFGTLEKAFVKLSEKYTSIARNGVFIQLSFTEDSADPITKGDLPSSRGSMVVLAGTADLELAAAGVKMKMQLDDAQSESGVATDLLSAVQALNASIAQINEDLARPVRQAAAISEAISDVIESSRALLSPANWPALNALLEVKDAVASAVYGSLSGTRPIKSYVPRGSMSVAGIAAATSNTVEDILQLNTLPDPFDIAEGETILVFDYTAGALLKAS